MHATLTQTTPRLYREQSKGNTHDTGRDSNSHILIYIYKYVYIHKDRYKPCFGPAYTQNRLEDSTHTTMKKEKMKNTTITELCRHGCGASTSLEGEEEEEDYKESY